MTEIKVLDHGYATHIESWGSDEGIVEAARMSTNKGFLGWGPTVVEERCATCNGAGIIDDGRNVKACGPCEGVGFISTDKIKPGDEKLLRYLYEHKHSTPFEMAGLTIEVQAPILVFRQWHRHRTQCLAPDTLVHFERRGQNGRRYVYKMRIEDVWKKWQPTIRRSRSERQTNALFKRKCIQEMSLRCLDEKAGEVIKTSVVDVIKGEPKPMVCVTTASGRSITATRAHRFMTSRGWMQLGEAIETRAMLTLEGTARAKTKRWERPVIREEYETWKPVLGWEELYEVSDEGRVRRMRGAEPSEPKRNTSGAQQYDVVSLSRGGKTYTRTVHTLVLDAFVGPCPDGHEARHLDDNRGNPSFSNLEWATAKRNAQDRVDRDRQQRLVSVFEEIVSVEEVGELPTYDLSVEGPWHNFVADGFVVHNSYNEMSARYTPLPDVNYMPTVDRCIVVHGGNKQARGANERTPSHEEVLQWLESLQRSYDLSQEVYERGLEIGIPKEVARCPVPVARYSRMRASANLRNWLAFLTLRMDSHAQEEIRVYAVAIGAFIQKSFPRTWGLFVEGQNVER